jgi:hypothetical protein
MSNSGAKRLIGTFIRPLFPIFRCFCEVKKKKSDVEIMSSIVCPSIRSEIFLGRFIKFDIGFLF